jgi:hypothetical protein
MHSLRSVLGRAFRFLRDAWLVLGVTFLLFLCLEGAYRAQGAVRRAWRDRAAPPLPPHPNANDPWFAGFDPQKPLRTAVRYDPYRGWWPTTYHDDVVSVDAAGLRVTPQTPAAQPGHRIFLFGGSAMYGYGVRDRYTIPAQLAATLRARGLADATVMNFGQSSFNATQEVVTLLLELRRGNVPDVVVFYDGNNEVSSAFQNGVVGQTLNQELAAARWRSSRNGLLGDIADVSRYSLLLPRLGMMLGQRPVGTPVAPAAEAVCGGVASYYQGLTRTVDGMAREFGFHPLYFWQPMLATSNKRRTAWESSLIEWGEGYGAMMQLCATTTDSAMSDRLGRTYFPLHTLFDRDTSNVFIDYYGHTTERANGVIADSLASLLIPILASSPPRPQGNGAEHLAQNGAQQAGAVRH